MKWIGAILIMGCGVWLAAALSRNLSARCREMSEMCAGWTRLGDRVGIYADRLSEAASQAAAVTKGTVRQIFEAFAVRLDEPWLEEPDKAWGWAVDAYKNALHMSAAEIIEIRQLGACVGQASMEEQRRGFADMRARLARLSEQAQNARKVGTALWTRWCFLIAAAAAIAVL
jgi:stage III sporulation protein AB